MAILDARTTEIKSNITNDKQNSFSVSPHLFLCYMYVEMSLDWKGTGVGGAPWDGGLWNVLGSPAPGIPSPGPL